MWSVLLFLIVVAPSKTTSNAEVNQKAGKCDMTKCGQESRIVFKQPIGNEITIQENDAKLTTWPLEEEIIYTYRRRFTAYCYQGTILDPNTGCLTANREIQVTKEEARKSVLVGECKTGCECGVNECSGSASYCCLTDELTIPVGPKTFGNTQYQTGMLALHTCTSRWACVTRKITVKPIIEGSKEFKRVARLADGKELVLDTKFYNEGTHYSDSVRYYSVSPIPPKPKKEAVRVKCYSSSLQSITCLGKTDGKEIAFPIDPQTLESNIRNMHLQVLGSITTVGAKGERINITRISQENEIGETRQEYIVERAASIGDINELINGIKTTQMQEISNVINNRNQIIEIENTIHKLISFLSKKYPRLLSSIFGGEYKTRWLNEEIFQLCPCNKQVDFPLHTNCVGSAKYLEGEPATTSSMTECETIDERKIHNISLTKINEELDTTTIDYLPPKTSSSEDPSWDWLQEMRTTVTDYQTPQVDYDKIKGMIGDYLPWFSWKDIMMYFCFTISILWLVEKIIVARAR